VALVTAKWGAQPHDAGTVQRLGDDRFGAWWWGPKGRPIRRGDEATPPRWVDLARSRALS
jgi:hypothetical protein